MKTKIFSLIVVLVVGFFAGVWVQEKWPKITGKMVAAAETLMGLEFTPAERDSLIPNLEDFRRAYQRIRAVPLSNDVPPALQFNPVPRGFTIPREQKPIRWSDPGDVRLPKHLKKWRFTPLGSWRR